MAKYVMALDAGTTSNRCILFNEKGEMCSVAQKEFTQYFPKPGWVEHDANEIWSTQLGVAVEAMQKIGASADDIAAIGITNQRETTIVWDKNTGEPVYHAIVWQCRRTSEYCDSLKDKGLEDSFRQKTGLVIDAYFSGTKLKWILDHVDGARERAERGELLAGTLNTWLFWKLTGGQCFQTDISSAGSMMLMDIWTTQWNQELLDLCRIPRQILPEICDNNHIYGYTRPEHFLGVRVPIAGGITDSPAGLIGGGCIGEGIIKTSYGTGSFMHLQTGERPVFSDSGLFTRSCWRLDGRPYYLLSGASYIAGGAVQWLKEIGLIETVQQTEELAMSVPDTRDVYFVPAFAGFATPYWDPYARGLFIGLTSGVSRAHLVRAVLESLACQVALCYRVMRQEFGKDSPAMRADGGMVENRFVMQFQADMLGIPVEVPAEKETCAFGAACLAGYTMGALPSLESVREYVQVKDVYEPRMSSDQREEKLARWQEAAGRSLDWARHV